MDTQLHNSLRSRIRQVIAERAGIAPVPEAEGGFLPFLPLLGSIAAPLAAAAAPVVGKAISKLMGDGAGDYLGDGKYYSHKPTARTHTPNRHAQKVKIIMDYYHQMGKKISLATASKMAKAEENMTQFGAPIVRRTKLARRAALRDAVAAEVERTKRNLGLK